jgi:DNA-directed RNA polymerase subunit A"
VLETSGSDIRRVLRIKGVDKTRTTTNHIVDVLNTFGIEAAREAII